MPQERPSLDFPQSVLRYATDVAGWQLEAAERDMQEHAECFPEHTRARERMAQTETDLTPQLGGDPMALEEYANANNAYAAALAIEMYLRGFLDGGRVYHAFVMRELPVENSSRK